MVQWYVWNMKNQVYSITNLQAKRKNKFLVVIYQIGNKIYQDQLAFIFKISVE